MKLSPVFCHRPVFAIGLAACLLAPGRSAETDLRDVIRDDFTFAAAQYGQLLAQVKDDPKLPRSFANGKIVTVRPEDWTSGFFPGALWLVYDYTRDAKWRTAAEDYTARLEKIKNLTAHHDVGFMLYCSYGQGLRLTGNPAYRDVLLQGAKSLSTRFNPTVGLIRSWDFGPWKYPVIIDNMMNLELLTWAARTGPEPRFREIALRHADQTLASHFRADGSSFHLVDYDPAAGAVIKKQTVQGAADTSAWARGQAWGLYGYTMMYRETRHPAYLAQAQKIARFLLNHPRLPEDKVPYWDYDAPGIPDEPRDTSAAAIMCSALIELSDFAEPELARQCLAVAERQLRSLSSPSYRAPLGANGNFLLLHGVGHKPEKREIDQPLIYGDYYFLEALLRYQAKLPAMAAAVTVQTDIEYGQAGGESLRLDACIPDGPGPFPAVILVHGGGWTAGDKNGGSSKGYIAPMHEPLTRGGFAWFSINYRLAPKHRYPAPVEDVETAIRWVKAHAAEYRVDPRRLALSGESAGAHLIAMAAIRATETTRVAAVVPFYGPFDLVGRAQPGRPLGPNMVALFGYKVMDEQAERALHDASPLNFVKPGLPPFLLVHGTADSKVPYRQSTDLQAELRQAGVPCELLSIKGGDHGMLNWAKLGSDYQTQVVAWLAKTLPPAATK